MTEGAKTPWSSQVPAAPGSKIGLPAYFVQVAEIEGGSRNENKLASKKIIKAEIFFIY